MPQKYLFQLLTPALLMLIFSLLASCGGGSTLTAVDSETQLEQSHGVAQKGPFAVGSDVRIEKIDSSGARTGDRIDTTVSKVTGQFSFQIPNDWDTDSYIKLDVTGNVYDEALGTPSTNELSLSSIVDISQKQNSINILTNWLSKRTQNLLLEGKDLKASLHQADQELNKIFGISNAGLLDFTSSVNDHLEDNALLLLLSGALMQVAANYDVSAQHIISQIGDDFAKDGFINQTGDDWLKRLQAEIRDNPFSHLSQFSQLLEEVIGVSTISEKQLPKVINFSSRPTSIVPKEIIVRPAETIVLDGTASHGSGEKPLINFTWFRVDQQSFSPVVVISNRFSQNPIITVPKIESELLYTLVVTDTDKLTDTSVIKVIVKKPDLLNIAPVVKDQSFVIDEDTDLDIVLEASDEDGDSLVYSFDTPLLLANSIVEGTPPSVKYTPDHNFNGKSLFTYTVHDGNEISNVGTVSIEVLPINDKPIADSQTLSTIKNQSLTNISLSGSDVDTGDTLSFFIKDNPQHGSLQGNTTSYTYTPDTDFVGNDSFTFFVNDGTLDSDLATVYINIKQTNNIPLAANDDSIAKEEDAATGNVVSNDTDPDGDTLTVTSAKIDINNNGTLDDIDLGVNHLITVSGAIGTIKISTNGDFEFIPEADFNGSVPQLTYTISDGNGGVASATLDITITPVNDAPIAKGHTTKGAIPSNPVTEQISVGLIGEDSTDDSSISNYEWKQIDIGLNDPTVTLTQTTPANVRFDAPVPTAANASTGNPLVLTFRLIVTDDGVPPLQGSTTSSNPDPARDDVLVYINARPVANAGSDKTWVEGLEITLQGSLSYDLEGSILYKWVQTSGTSVGLSSGYTSTSVRTFKAPAVATGSTDTLVFELTVRDENGVVSIADTVIMTVEDDVCDPPIANAGVDRDVSSENRITLIGGGSVDGCGTSGDNSNRIINYNWVQVDDIGNVITPTVILDDSTAQYPRFNAPLVTAGVTSLYFKLVVQDLFTVSSPDIVKFNVYPTGVLSSLVEPIATPLNAPIGASGFIERIYLAGTDPDGEDNALTFEIDSDPDPLRGSLGTLQYYGQVFYNPVFSIMPDQPVVENSFTFTVMDQDGLVSAPALVNLIPKTPPAGNLPPVAKDAHIVVPSGSTSQSGFTLSFNNPDSPLVNPNEALVSAPEMYEFIRMYEISRDETNNVTFNLLQYSSAKSANLVMLNHSGLSSGATGSFNYILVDEYGQKSNIATITIEFEP